MAIVGAATVANRVSSDRPIRQPSRAGLAAVQSTKPRTRVILSSIDHPIVGDPVYGQRRPNLQLKRPFLHAVELEFDHPATGDSVIYRSELAADLADRLTTLRRLDPDS